MKKIKFSVPDSEHAGYVREAEKTGMPLEEWIRAKLRGDLRAAPIVLEEAFRQLDVSDAMRELSGEPPELKVPATVELRVSALGKPQRTDHACVHHAELLRADGGPPKVCGHPSQVGRPCHWPSNRAVDCLMFTPRMKK